jgi:phage terminase large subunit-like protein
MTEQSLAERFAALPDARRKKILAALTAREKTQLEYTWEWWARPKQLEPPGDWRVWLLLSGRGAGKTRTGAEWVRKLVEQGRACRIGLVTSTAADTRDVVVEGESGLLAVCPPWNRPLYEPSRRRLTWPNGAIATRYSAEEPDRLRGPQHDAAWCLVGETMVTMGDGTARPIRDVEPGDTVATPIGPRRVLASAITRRHAEVFRMSLSDGRAVIATADHPVFVFGVGFVPMDQLQRGMRACAIGAFGGADARGTCGDADTTRRTSGCTARYGAACTGRFPRDMMFITSTTTGPTIGLRTSCCSAERSIARCTPKLTLGLIEQEVVSPRVRRSERPSTNESVHECSRALGVGLNIEVARSTPRVTVRQSASTPQDPVDLKVRLESARDAAPRSQQRSASNFTVRSSATRGLRRTGARRASRESCRAPSAATRSEARVATHGSVLAHADYSFTAEIVSVERLAEPRDVFDIAVDGARAFFANGVLVHNCDELGAWRYPEAWDQLQFGLRLGADPRVVVTTTPRPTPIIRQLVSEPTTITKRGSTYENRAHLAPGFLQEIERRYAQTRLGRQEIFGEILDDHPGALFARADIEKARVRDVPPLIRIVVAVDPAISNHEGSNETGIVVVGLGTDINAYVLEDLSGRYSPYDWARTAVEAYHRHRADRVIAEKNQGGALVESNLRTVDPRIPYKGVVASRGKQTRAEPVAALYEQGRVHHVGYFAALEDQMVCWEPGPSAESPDRVDALVWGVFELLLDVQPVARDWEHLPPA